MRKKYLSEQFNEQDFAQMNSNNIYAINSVPGSGKTTLIIDVLQPYLQKKKLKALYLSPRKIINEQNETKFNNTVIHSTTYQQLEYYLLHEKDFLKNYDFIICDEAHYFVADSGMNSRTNFSFDFVNQSKAILILMSGTPDYLDSIIDLWARPIIKLTNLDKNNHNIRKLYLASANLNENKLLKKKLYELAKGGKRIVVYDSNIENLFEIYAEYNRNSNKLDIKTSFICSSHNSKYSSYISYDTLRRLIENGKAPCDLLFITSAINTGVSIDDDFDCLFIFGNSSMTDIYQLIARIRKGKNGRKIDVYCSVPKSSSIRSRIHPIRQALSYLDDPVEWGKLNPLNKLPPYIQLLHKYTLDANGKKNFDDNGKPLNNYQKAINTMALAKAKQDIKEYNRILSIGNAINAYKQLFENRYNNLEIILFNQYMEQECFKILEETLKKQSHHEYLLKEQQDIIKAICKHYELKNSIAKINELLNKYGSVLKLISKQKKLKGQVKQVWEVKR